MAGGASQPCDKHWGRTAYPWTPWDPFSIRVLRDRGIADEASCCWLLLVLLPLLLLLQSLRMLQTSSSRRIHRFDLRELSPPPPPAHKTGHAGIGKAFTPFLLRTMDGSNNLFDNTTVNILSHHPHNNRPLRQVQRIDAGVQPFSRCSTTGDTSANLQIARFACICRDGWW